MAGSFTATVDAWVAQTKARMLAVRNDATQSVINVMQLPGPSVANPDGGAGGHMPIDTGFLRSSLTANIGDVFPALRDNPDPKGSFTWDPQEVNLVIAEAKLSDPITAVYSAAYAKKVEERYAFVRLAAQQWQQIVTASVDKAKAAVAANTGAGQ